MAETIVNGVARQLPRSDARSLLAWLRDELRLTGAKPGCGEGDCGSCTVIVDGRAVRSCRLKLREMAGRRVVTVEGLAAGGQLHPVQRAFVDAGAWQCGYCTPGMITAAVALLERNSSPSRAEIVAALDGNLCRCCAYPRIVDAVERAAAAMRGAR